jgi:hypothetical protein
MVVVASVVVAIAIMWDIVILFEVYWMARNVGGVCFIDWIGCLIDRPSSTPSE